MQRAGGRGSLEEGWTPQAWWAETCKQQRKVGHRWLFRVPVYPAVLFTSMELVKQSELFAINSTGADRCGGAWFGAFGGPAIWQWLGLTTGDRRSCARCH
jgi:hypothetical protein